MLNFKEKEVAICNRTHWGILKGEEVTIITVQDGSSPYDGMPYQVQDRYGNCAWFPERHLSKKEDRKKIPIASGVIKYFPKAIKEVAKVSFEGNVQHGNGVDLIWDRSKSADHEDALCRHLTDYLSGEEVDSDRLPHLAKVAWRALASLEIYLENQN